MSSRPIVQIDTEHPSAYGLPATRWSGRLQRRLAKASGGQTRGYASGDLRGRLCGLVLARARLLAGMRRGGILIADVPPEAVVSSTVNEYLRIKRSGAL